jgi:hypothetical protein
MLPDRDLSRANGILEMSTFVAIVAGVAYFEKLAFVSALPHAIRRRGALGFAAMRARAAT